ncbi:MAG: 2'-5' RNA ligase family protein [Rhodospirillales bacterium]|nr:2'-5' RNA ligase family protein [Rhodospirillales bacterium]
MRYAVILPATFEDEAAAKIDAIRAASDPLHGKLAAHVTLVYPTETETLATPRDALAAFAKQARALDVTFEAASAAFDHHAQTNPHLVYLLPDATGRANLVELRRQLPLKAPGGDDPHVTVARTGANEAAVALAREAGAFLPLRVRFARAALVMLDGPRVDVVVDAPLT